MSGLQDRSEDTINGVDVREQGSALRVATNTPHLVSLGTGRLSTAVTLHPIKQGRVTIGSDPTCDIYVVGRGVASVHCRVENSHGVVTLYPVCGSTLVDHQPIDKPTRLSQGSMLTIGRSNYLRFNHPAEAKLMKSVLPSAHVSMAPMQFSPNEQCMETDYVTETNQCYQTIYHDPLSQYDQELDLSLKEITREKPPLAPKKYQNEDQDEKTEKPKMTSIMAKVSKFEYYAKQNKIGRSQFYTNENEISPKVFSSNSLTVNTPAKDVLGVNKPIPNYMKKSEKYSEKSEKYSDKSEKIVHLTESNAFDSKSCSYVNVAIKNNKLGDLVRNFDEKLPKKVNNEARDNVYGKINTNRQEYCQKDGDFKENLQDGGAESSKGAIFNGNLTDFDQTPQYKAVYSGRQFDRSMDAENMRNKAYQERVKEEEKKEAEMERLEEILDIFTEYQKQLNTDIRGGMPVTPTEKRPHNKIITNGSLPRNGAFNNANLVKTSDGYYKFDTSHSRTQRNVSSYENFEPNELTPEISLPDVNYQNVGRMDEIGIPVFDEPTQYQKESPSTANISNVSSGITKTPSPSPYENVYAHRNVYNSLKPKSPNTNSPRSKIKTSFAHKNLPSPQYFIFPTPPPTDRKPDFGQSKAFGENKSDSVENRANVGENKPSLGGNQLNLSENRPNVGENRSNFTGNTTKHNRNEIPTGNQSKGSEYQTNKPQKFLGIEKQLSVEGEIPMIDDTGVTNDIELRYSQIIKETDVPIEKPKDETNKSFEDVKKELMADIPELEAFEKDLKDNKRERIIKNLAQDINIIRNIDIDTRPDNNMPQNVDIVSDGDTSVLDINIEDLKSKYDRLKEERKGLVTEIHEIKCKMAEIRSQEDDILRELEMEKALIKGEYDSEIAILNIEQKKKTVLLDKARQIEQEIKELKEKQEMRQNDMRERVDIATMKVERIEKDMKTNTATVEELQNAQDILDNETKIYEDLEFQHLEEESELLSNREDLQNEIILLTKKIEAQKTRILTLKSEANNNLTSALDETKVLHAEYVKLLNKVEGLTSKVQTIEKHLKPIVAKLNEIERAQSPDSAFYTDQTRGKSGEFSYSPQSSDSDEIDPKTNFEEHTKEIKDKFNSIDQMSQSMTVDIERRIDRFDSPKKEKEKKGFWERNFDSLKRKKKPKSPDKTEKVDIMSQSLNENFFYNNDSIENDTLDRFNSLRNSKKKDKDKEKASGPIKSNSSSKIPTFAALGKIIKKDSFTKKSKDIPDEENSKIRYIKNLKPVTVDNKYMKAKSLSPDKINGRIAEEFEPDNFQNGATAKILHRKSCGDEPNDTDLKDRHISDRIPSQDDIDRISKITIDAPLIASDTDMNSLGKRTLDSLMEVERKRFEMLEEQGCQVIENEREKIIELKRRAQDETKKLWDQKYREKSIDSDTFSSLNENRKSTEFDRNPTEKPDDTAERAETSDFDRSNNYDRSNNFGRSSHFDRMKSFDEANKSSNFDRSGNFDRSVKFDRSGVDESSLDDSYMASSTIYEESSGLMSSSIEELQVRNSRTESTEDDKRSDDSRPLSHVSDFSRDNILSLSGAPRRSRRAIAPYPESQRPLTRYLPVDRDDFDLQSHLHSAGHQIELCPYVTVTSTSCRGYLHKLGAKFHTWSKRWFVFDRETKTFVYYWDKSEKKPRGGAYFQVIQEVYLDHGNTSKSPSPQTTFIVKTRQRVYYLMAPSGEAARIWIDVIFTGAQGYTDYLE